jgi:hypothetical protein
MSQIGRHERYSRTLVVPCAAPSHTRPTALTRRASAQSSMISWRMLSTPPIASNVARRISMQPPAAPAVLLRGSATQRGGYSMKKNNTKAGISSRSHRLRQLSRTISETRSYPPLSARATSAARLCGVWTMSASVSSR